MEVVEVIGTVTEDWKESNPSPDGTSSVKPL
jgi:hypothetical protein